MVVPIHTDDPVADDDDPVADDDTQDVSVAVSIPKGIELDRRAAEEEAKMRSEGESWAAHAQWQRDNPNPTEELESQLPPGWRQETPPPSTYEPVRQNMAVYTNPGTTLDMDA
jgi:hypothetical protein